MAWVGATNYDRCVSDREEIAKATTLRLGEEPAPPDDLHTVALPGQPPEI